MFDVVWTDPNKESVGERNKRKERESIGKDKDKKKYGSGRNSFSTSSSTSSERAFAFWSARSRNRTPTPASLKIANDSSVPTTTNKSSEGTPTTTSLRTADDSQIDMTIDKSCEGTPMTASLKISNDSPIRTTIDKRREEKSYAHDSQAPRPLSDKSELTVNTAHEHADGCFNSSPRESVNSKWTHPSITGSSTLIGSSPRNSTIIIKGEQLIQPLGHFSYVTQCTETIISDRNFGSDGDCSKEVRISSARVNSETPSLPELPEESASATFDNSGVLILQSHLSRTSSSAESQTTGPVCTSGWNSNDQMSNPDMWKAPQEWDCSSSRGASSPTMEEMMQSEPETEEQDAVPPGLPVLQREVQSMVAASYELLLSNLKSNLKSDMDSCPDATVYNEIEMAQKRWMFAAMHQVERYGDFDLENRSGSKRPKVLAIYETPASASFLAALHPDVTITHLSPNPVSARLFPNVQPILVPATSASAASRPLPPQLYSAVTCLSMAAIFPSAEIPPFLRHVNRCLVPGGALHLTLIDPQPISSTMGPKLRQWLFEKLLINLEEKSRTTYPASTFPKWLAVSRLRGKGSTITKVVSFAVPEAISKFSKSHKQSGVEAAELKCLVTRKLWQEVWGNHVRGDRWWWDESDIVEECIEHGTMWEYDHIVAVKE